MTRAGCCGASCAAPAPCAITLRGGYQAAARLTGEVRLFTHAVSLGGVDSLIQHPAALTHRPVAAEFRPGGDVVRLSVGLEHADDLIGDLQQALVRCEARPRTLAEATA